MTAGASLIYSTTPYGYLSTAGDYFAQCYNSLSSFSISVDSSGSPVYFTSVYTPVSSCTIYTQCSGGNIFGTFGDTTYSSFYAGAGYQCFSWMSFDKFGDTTGGLTSLMLAASLSGQKTATFLYQNKPAISK
jgi:hypothetical protein